MVFTWVKWEKLLHPKMGRLGPKKLTFLLKGIGSQGWMKTNILS